MWCETTSYKRKYGNKEAITGDTVGAHGGSLGVHNVVALQS